MKNYASVLFTALLTASVLLSAPFAAARTDRLIVEDGNSAASNEAARQSKEQWNDTRNLRSKINTRTEKEFDKADRAFDTRDACEKSYNVNAYWEENTLRCLDRRTGRPVAP